jgi:hypothetical protein
MAELHELNLGPITLLAIEHDSTRIHVSARVLGAGMPGSRPMCGTVVLRREEWHALERLTDYYAELDRRVADMTRAIASRDTMIGSGLASALVRMLWTSVADHAQCTCALPDACPECEAMVALGLGRWITHEIAAKQLEQLTKERT